MLFLHVLPILHAVFVAGKLCHVLNACGHVEKLLWIGAEVEVLLVVPDACGVFVVDVCVVVIDILAVLAIQELSIATLKVNLQPAVGVGHCPEVAGSNAYLWNGLGISALGEGTR